MSAPEESLRARQALEFLDLLEIQEASLLSWGLIDGAFSADEVVDLAESFLDEKAEGETGALFADSKRLVKWLLDRTMLWKLPHTEGRCRTRMGESVRLFARLKQLFSSDGWRSGPSLVSDFRFILRPRRYPPRHITPGQLLEQVRAIERPPSGGAMAVIESALSHDGGAFALAPFQVEATKRILAHAGSSKRSGTIVCAGTGSGKTLAFYLPAFAWIADSLDDSHWTRCLALYPRKELLKDQLSSTLDLAAKVAGTLHEQGRRSIEIGAYFGDVPFKPADLLGPNSRRWYGSWAPTTIRDQGAYSCPFVNCPKCGGALAWTIERIQQEVEQLECLSCTHLLAPDLIRLTRQSLRKRPPDILFSTTESLNQRLSSSYDCGLFGVGTKRRPGLLLLDEVHTYEGTHGAQVALTLRRWKHLSGARPHFVGLSATLADAARFMADLVDLFPDQVSEISTPHAALEQDGMEYQLALRGNPVSGANLLSTSIQTAMLARRILDTREDPRSGGAAGHRVFAFTDNLDVTNRLFHNLLDAEGWFAPGRPALMGDGSLANIRRSGQPSASGRFDAGQAWNLVEDIGHSLQPGERSVVSRTSSQDSGVAASSDIVVATASLEVGFDDPDVGIVLQHKAPLSGASYLQRKGRAGRQRGMRPWSIVVLSDYGRDRVAYSNYDQLFDPELRPRFLPIRNRYVLKIQAVYCLLDWLRHRTKRGDMWSDLAKPSSQGPSGGIQQSAARLARSLLEEPDQLATFRTFLKESLAIDFEEVDGLLWEPPRSLLLEVIPTLLRRLDRNWELGGGGKDTTSRRHPLPEFIPRALFDDLNLPEVLVRRDDLTGEDESWMPIAQTLREFSPGRVSKRFSIKYRKARLWVPPPSPGSNVIPIESFCRPEDIQFQGTLKVRRGSDQIPLAAVRPFGLDVRQPEKDVLDSSNSFPNWHSHVAGQSDGDLESPPKDSPWLRTVEEVRFHTHANGCPAEARRFTTGGRGSVGRRGASGGASWSDLEFTYTLSGAPAALGFTLDVDAVEFRIRLPTDLGERLNDHEKARRALRPSFFLSRLLENQNLAGVASRFQSAWLGEVLIATAISIALDGDLTLSDSFKKLTKGNDSAVLENAIARFFLTSANSDQQQDALLPEKAAELVALFRLPEVRKAIDQAAPALWGEPDRGWEKWLRQRFVATLGAGLLSTCENLCQDLDVGELLLDFEIEDDPKHECSAVIWISEATPGGSGFIEAIQGRYVSDPRHFFWLLKAAFAETDLEHAERSIGQLLRWLTPTEPTADSELQEIASEVRQSESLERTRHASTRLRNALAERGLVLTHASSAAIHARVLRPGSNQDTDVLISELLKRWNSIEAEFGIEVSARAMAFIASESSQLDRSLSHLGNVPPPGSAGDWRVSVLGGLLWERGSSLRRQALGFYNPFRPAVDCDRLLIDLVIERHVGRVTIASEDWRARLADELRRNGQAALVGSPSEQESLYSAALSLLIDPLDIDGLLLHPRLREIVPSVESSVIVFDLPEAAQ